MKEIEQDGKKRRKEKRGKGKETISSPGSSTSIILTNHALCMGTEDKPTYPMKWITTRISLISGIINLQCNDTLSHSWLA